MDRRRWGGYVALGDAITEGAAEPRSGARSSWASRLAAILDGNARLDGRRLDFHNYAAGGQRMRDVTEHQVPRALAAHPDLVSIMAGGSELSGRRPDPDRLAERLEGAVTALRGAGIDVLIASVVDPQLAFFMRPTRSRVAAFNANVWSIARAHQSYILDLWGIRELQEPSMWTADRGQFSVAGHRLVAKRAARTLGVPYFELGIEATAPDPHHPVLPVVDV